MAPSRLHHFTTYSFDFSQSGYGVRWRAFYEAHLTEDEIPRLKIAEGRALEAFTARDALARLRLVPYDAFALWMHANNHRLSAGSDAHG